MKYDSFPKVSWHLMSFTYSLPFISSWLSYYIGYADAVRDYAVAVCFHEDNCTIVKAIKLILKLSCHSFERYSLNYQWSFFFSNSRSPEDSSNWHIDLQPSYFDQGDILKFVLLPSTFMQNPAILLTHLQLSTKAPSPSLSYEGIVVDHRYDPSFDPAESS